MALHTIDLPCIKDTWVDSTNPTATHGSDTSLKGGFMTGSMGSMPVDIMCAFDWSSLPSGKTIKSMILRFYNVTAITASGDECFLLIGSLGKAWAETISYNDYHSGGGVQYLNNANIPGNQYIEVDITDRLVSLSSIRDYGISIQWESVVGNGIQPNYITIQSREAANPSMLRITYDDALPDAPIPKGPIGARDNKSIICFEWEYSSSVGDKQSKFDLQWSVDQLTWTTITRTSVNNYYDMPANTLPAGNIYWRVRCYNPYSEVGPYCATQSFYAIGAPPVPIINSVQANSARPIIAWSVTGQQIYQLQVLSGDTIVYDSGNQPSISARQHKVMAFLADGTYAVQLHVKNEYGLWSEWGTASVTIATVKPVKPLITATKTQYGQQFKATQYPASYVLLYRDGACIEKQINRSPVDNLVRSGKGEEGTTPWIYATSVATLTFESGKFKFVTTSARVANQAITVKPNTNYYLSGNVSGTDATLRAYHSDATTVLRIGPGSFNTGSNTTIWVAMRNGSATTSYFDSIMLVEGTTAPAQYKPYNEAYTLNDNAVENGSEHTYKVRAVTEGSADVYSDSDSVTATVDFKYALVAPVSDLTNVFSFTSSLNSPPRRVYDNAPGGVMVQYAGRRYPVWEPDEHMSAGLSCGAFYLETWTEFEVFKAMHDLKETVLYRDTKGRKIYGILTNLQVSEERLGYTVSFVVNQVDYNEEVEV
jgi:hypothetical protein